MTDASLVTVGAAVRALRVRRSVAVAWLREHDLIRTVAGRERVIWGDVLAAVRGGTLERRTVRPSFRGMPREAL
jgi:hypothetical protein